MASLTRDSTLHLKSEVNVGKDKVFEFLKANGVNPSVHLLAVQELPGRCWDITFTSVNWMWKFYPSLSSDNTYTVNTYTNSATTLVNVLFVPHELDDNVVRFVLGKYGKVVCGRYMTFADYPQVFNGKRQYQIELHKDIPSSIRLGGRNCWVRYYGQPRTCLKCGGKGHDARECKVTVCFRCQKLGHIASECKEPVQCTVCQKLGHSFKECPISFANKINPAPLRWVSGSAVTVSNEECVEVADNELDWSSVSSQPVSQDPQPTVQNERQVALVTVGDTGDSDGSSTVCSQEGTDTHEVEFDSVTDVTEVTATVTEVTDTATDAQMDVDSGSQSQSLFKGVQGTVLMPPISKERTDHKMEDNTSQADGQTSQVPGDGSKDQLPRSSLGKTPNDQSTSPLETQISSRTTDLPEDNVVEAKSNSSSSDALENMELFKTTQDSHDWATVSRGRSSSQPTPSKRKCRSRSNLRFASEDPIDSVKMAQIFLEDEPWHSCYSKSCRESFSKFDALMDHVAKEHPKLKPPCYPCARKSCRSMLDHPKEWILHLATRHPDFVKEQELEFFDRYFLKS